MMCKLSAAATLALLLSAGASADERVVAPDFTLSTPAGRHVTLDEEVQQQTTLLFFWATWCPYCKALMPHLQSMRLEHGDDLEILAINMKEDGDPVAFLADAGYDFTLLLDGDAVAEAYEVTGTPGVFVVDRHRTVRFDLRDLPRMEPPDDGKPAGHTRRAAYRAPYWAAEIRKSVATVLAGEAPAGARGQ